MLLVAGQCNYFYFTAVILTERIPLLVLPIFPNAALVRSIMRPCIKGPLSFTFTLTLLPFSRLVTRSIVPNGNFLWAAVMAN